MEQAEVDALLDSLRGEDLVWFLDDLRAWRQASRGGASWHAGVTARELLALYERRGVYLSEETLDRIDAAKSADRPLEGKSAED